MVFNGFQWISMDLSDFTTWSAVFSIDVSLFSRILAIDAPITWFLVAARNCGQLCKSFDPHRRSAKVRRMCGVPGIPACGLGAK